MFMLALFIITTNCKQPKCPSVDERLNKLEQPFHKMLLSNKKSIVDICNTWCGLQGYNAE